MKKNPGRKARRQYQREEARRIRQNIKRFAEAKKRREEKSHEADEG